MLHLSIIKGQAVFRNETLWQKSAAYANTSSTEAKDELALLNKNVHTIKNRARMIPMTIGKVISRNNSTHMKGQRQITNTRKAAAERNL